MNQGRAALEPYAHLLTRSIEEAAADLERYAALLLKWNKTQNLVSRETVGQLWPRHIADSLQVLPLVRDSDTVAIDLGSGGGFPAIPLAVARKGVTRYTLVEPNNKKASFLKAVGRELELPIAVETLRTEMLDVENLAPIDVITSRALAPLHQLLGLAAPLWGANTRAILHKGREHVEELAEAGAKHYFDMVVHPSRTDDSGVLLEISNLRKR